MSGFNWEKAKHSYRYYATKPAKEWRVEIRQERKKGKPKKKEKPKERPYRACPPMTEKQRRYLLYLGVYIPEFCTVATASRLIDKEKRRRVDEAKRLRS